MPSKITKIPYPGGSGKVPSGAIQFQDDWPGLFLRGDVAISLASRIRYLEKKLAGHPDPLVEVCIAQIAEIARIIEEEVDGP